MFGFLQKLIRKKQWRCQDIFSGTIIRSNQQEESYGRQCCKVLKRNNRLVYERRMSMSSSKCRRYIKKKNPAKRSEKVLSK